MFNNHRFDDYPAEKITKHPLRPSLCAVDRDDSKMRRSDLFDSILNDPRGFADAPTFGWSLIQIYLIWGTYQGSGF
ncbi:hypothetical protein Pla52n_18110 [Stieleria varia]|uniref:Uncharacterized protein n=1 Tax=Stieleria varia TaxID=2528005 RepID=A0A5C6B3P6_9BACT|nr:hypothetical protein Pla52n_18110 [Stieleria varia]